VREASVVTTICTFHFARTNGEQQIAGTIPIPITVTDSPNGGWSITYNPDGHDRSGQKGRKEVTQAYACAACAERLFPAMAERKDWFVEKIVQPVKFEEDYEEPALVVEDEPHLEEESAEKRAEDEDWEEVDDEVAEDVAANMNEADREAYEEHLRERAETGPVGEKVKAHVNNPTPEQSDPDAEIPRTEEGLEFTAAGWKVYFPENYTIPDPKVAPKGEERIACEQWYKDLSDKQKVLAGKWTPRLTRDLVTLWRKSRQYADFAGIAAV